MWCGVGIAVWCGVGIAERGQHTCGRKRKEHEKKLFNIVSLSLSSLREWKKTPFDKKKVQQ